MAESYVQRWARENAERSVAEQKEQKSDLTEEKGVGPGDPDTRCEGQTEKKGKNGRRKSAKA